MTRTSAGNSPTVRTSVLLPESSYAQIRAVADANRVSSAWVIRHAILRFLDERSSQLRLPLQDPDA